MPPSVDLLARCHCGAFELPISLPADELPQHKTVCVCDRCRHGTGSLGVVTVTLPGPPAASVLDVLTLREMAGGSGEPHLLYRCSTCGAATLSRITSDGDYVWGVYPSVLDRTAGVVKIVGFDYCEGPGDTGIAAFLPELPVFSGKADESPRVPATRTVPAEIVHQTAERLPVRCGCGSIDLIISRPAAGAEAYCYNPSPIPGGETRFLTTACACRSCRTTTASCLPALAVTHVPWQDLHRASDPTSPLLTAESWSPDVNLPGAVAYRSSDKATRYRCASECGASLGVVTTAMPGILKISTGLLRAGEGPRAETWAFWWTGTDEPDSPMPPAVNAADEALDQSLMRDWTAGLKRWGIEVGLRS